MLIASRPVCLCLCQSGHSFDNGVHNAIRLGYPFVKVNYSIDISIPWLYCSLNFISASNL